MTRRELALIAAAVFYVLLYLVCGVVVVRNMRGDLPPAPTPTTWHSGPGDLVEVTP